jgi:hypothetical protein
LQGVGPGWGAGDGGLVHSEFQRWQVYDAGGPAVIPKVLDWRLGPDWAMALRQAEAQGWHMYDREPGTAPGEHSIIHLKRVVSR